jgi:5-methylcytosine-specific restriction endonuclease McrA
VNILTNKTILRVNGNYQRLGWCSAQDAFTALMGENQDGSPPALGVDIMYDYDEYGKAIVDKMKHFESYEWELWMMLEGRVGDLDKFIHTSKRVLRIPTVIVCPRFRQMPTREQKASPSSIRERDGNKCQYTGVQLTNKTFSLDHVLPKSKGGRDTWDNLVAAHKDFNSRKGNKLNHEIGAKLLRPIPPARRQPISATVKGSFHPDHEFF